MAAESKRGVPLRAWRDLSAHVRFERARGRCERCARPHSRTVHQLNDGRWWDEDAGCWRGHGGERLPWRAVADGGRLRAARVALLCAVVDPQAPPGPANVLALCRCCHMRVRAPAYRLLRRLARLRRRALGDLFDGPYPSPNAILTSSIIRASSPS